MDGLLLARVDARLAQLGLSDRAASIAATGRPNLIRQMRSRGSSPSIDKMAKLAQVLGVSLDWLVTGL